MKNLFTILLCFIATLALAQAGAGRISGTVTDHLNQGIDGATVSLLRAKDARLVKVALSDKKGFFEFDKIAAGEYIVSITSTGFQKKALPKMLISQDTLH